MKHFYPVLPKQVKNIIALAVITAAAISLPDRVSAQAPMISYSSPQTYTTNVAITTLTPASSSVAAPAYSSTPGPIGSGFNDAYGIAVDAAGNVYVADQHNNAIKEIPFSGGAIVSIGSGFSGPTGVVIDGSGNIYVADFGNAAVEEIPAGSTTPVSIGSGFVGPHGIAVDASGNVYVVDTGNNELIEIPVGGGTEVVLASGLNDPSGVAVDALGNIFVAETGSVSGDVKEFPAGGAAALLVGSGFTNPTGVAIDASGNLFIADPGVPNVKEIPAGGTTQVIIGNTFTFPGGIAVDGAGNVLVTDLLSTTAWKINPTGGYFTNPALPAGLAINGTTGKISGTPAMYSPATNYTIIAWNATGSAKATLRIAINTTLPAIAYGGAKTYTAGTAITSITPTNTGGPVAAPAYSSSTASLGSGFNRPQGLVVDAAGNVYVSDFNTGTVQKIPAGGGTPVVIGTGLSDPQGLAIDASGYIYVADHNNGVVKKMPPAGGTPVVVAGGFNDPDGVAFDAAGNLYIADGGNRVVKELLAGASTPITIADGFGDINGIAADAFGNVYVADGGNSAVYEIPAGSSTYFTMGSGFISVDAVAVDAAGNVFVADFNRVKEITAANGSTVTLPPVYNGIFALAVNAAGNLYVADNNDSAISEIKPTGGYNLSRALPAGLTFSSTTGIISGTPTVASPATNYTIIGYNVDGGSSATQSITVNLPTAPVISYSSPVTYSTITAISPLMPANSGGVVDAAGFSANLTSLGSGFNLPFGLAAGASGNVYVADAGNSVIEKIPPGGVPAVISSAFANPAALAVDDAGNVFVVDNTTQTIKKIPGGTGTPTVVASGFSQATGVAVDASGNIYVSDDGNNAIYELPAGGTLTPLGAGFNSPRGVAVDAAGNVYVADYGNNAVKEIPAGSGTVVSLGAGFSFPAGVAVDAEGNVYVADSGSGTLKEIPLNSSSVITIHSGFGQINGVAADAAGAVYVTDVQTKAVSEIKPVGGYFINKILPSGLTFNNTTGVISGTPAVVSPATNYTVTAYNYGGRSQTVVNITVNALMPPTLSYSSPQDYSIGNAITPLAPTGSGVAALGFATTTSPYGSGFSNPFNISFDASGNMYVADYLNNAVKKVPVGNGSPVTLGSGFNRPTGVVVDSAGNVFVDDSGNKLIKIIPAGSNTPVAYSGDYFNPQGLTIDLQGNLYCLDGGSVLQIPAGGFGAVVKKTGFTNAFGLAIDAANNIYVADYNNNEIKKFPLAGGPTTIIGYLQFGSPEGVAVDAAGNVYVAYTGNNTVVMYPADGGSPVNIGSGYGGPTGVAVDASGVAYVADANSSIERVVPIGGYFLNRPLFSGLTFSNATGIVSGTPTGIPPYKNFTVTGYNPAGSKAAGLSININPFPLNYGAAQTFNTGVAITPIMPVSSGVAAPGYSSVPATIALNLTDANAVTFDAAGNKFVSGIQAVYKITLSGIVTTINFTNNPQGIAVDAAGNLYVTTGLAPKDLYKIPAGTNTPQVVQTGFNSPSGVALDAAGNIYVLDEGPSSHVLEFRAMGGPVLLLGTFGDGVNGLAVDAAGDVYLSGGPENDNYEIPAGGGPAITIPVGGVSTGVAIDPSGNMFTTVGGNIVENIATGGTRTVAVNTGNTSGGLYYQLPLTADGAGNIYAFNITGSPNYSLEEIRPIGGYYINPALPAGLIFNNTTGAISGTPTAPSPATTYTITAYNGSGASSTATITITVNLVNPTVTYSSPKTFPIGIAITPLAPVSNSVSPPGYSPIPATIGGVVNPVDVAPDGAGNVYVACQTGIYKIPPGGGAGTFIYSNGTTSGNIEATAVAIDAAGNVYFTAETLGPGGGHGLYKIPAGSTTPVTVSTSFYYAVAVATDAAGNVYVADVVASGAVYIDEFKGGGGTATVLGNFNSGQTIAVSSDGDVYVKTVDNILKISKGGAQVDTIKENSINSQGLALDGAGNFYTDGGDGIYEIPAGGGTPQMIVADHQLTTNGPGISYTTSLAIDGSGNLYAINNAINHPTTGVSDIEKINPIGGYYITPTIPAGISFSNATGVISGTPTALSLPTNYTVTAYNNYGGVATQTINMQVVTSANSNLSKLVLSNGTLSPVFAAGTTSYASTVANSVSSITETPTATDVLAAITVNGATVASGSKSAAVNLNIGANVITTVVTSQDGTTTKTYTVTVTRAASTNDNLSSLKMSKGIFSPAFAGGTASYADAVGNAITSVTVTPTAADPGATIKVNGAGVVSGAASGAVNLRVGLNTIYIVVTAQDGTTTKTYTVTVTRAASTNDNLSSLKMSKGIFSPAFTGGTASYADAVGNAITSVTVTPTADDPGATIKVNGAGVVSGTASGAVNLRVGPNTIYIVVTAQDGTTTKTYAVTVTRAASTNDNLSSLKMSKGIFSPAFAGGTASYADAVGNTITSVTVTPTAADADATIQVNGTTVPSGTVSTAINLAIGANTINVVVTASDKVTTKTYTVTVTRALSNNDNLSSLKMSKGIFSPAFASATTSYTDAVGNTITSVTVTPTTADPTATVKVNGHAVTSGTASQSINVPVGTNKITVTVTAQDGKTAKNYTVTVTRAGSTNDNLSSLKMSKGIFSPSFASGATSYTDAVGNAIASVTVTPTTADPTATVQVNGTTVPSGTASGAINLAVGSNTVEVAVTAQDGTTTKTYTVTVNRDAGSADSFNNGISVNNPAGRPSFDDDIIVVHQGVSPNGDGVNDFLVIDGIQAYPDNKLSIMNRNGQLIYEARGYDNSSKVFDGHSNKNGQMQLPGTYFYQLDYTVSGIAKHKTGFIVLKY